MYNAEMQERVFLHSNRKHYCLQPEETQPPHLPHI